MLSIISNIELTIVDINIVYDGKNVRVYTNDESLAQYFIPICITRIEVSPYCINTVWYTRYSCVHIRDTEMNFGVFLSIRVTVEIITIILVLKEQ